LATRISHPDAGVINSCSRVPVSFSRTTVVAEINELVRVSTTPIMPGTKNQLLSRPGL
jgi:hypothetical protein